MTFVPLFSFFRSDASDKIEGKSTTNNVRILFWLRNVEFDCHWSWPWWPWTSTLQSAPTAMELRPHDLCVPLTDSPHPISGSELPQVELFSFGCWGWLVVTRETGRRVCVLACRRRPAVHAERCCPYRGCAGLILGWS